MEQPKIYLPHRPKTVALLAMGPSVLDFMTATLTQEMTLGFADEIWAINMAANTFNHDVVFWMDDLISQNNYRSGLIDLLRKRGKPVITCTRRPELVPSSYDYPISEVASLAIPVFGKPYLNNGVAMAIGYALHIGVRVLKIFGADFTYPNRDFAESGRACVECWITLAGIRGMGIELCPNTSLMDNVKDHGIYGYDEQPAVHFNGGVYRYIAASATGGPTGAGKYRGGNNTVIYEEDGTAHSLTHQGLTYKPEDSSGAFTNGHDIQADVPGVGSAGAAAQPNGAAGHAEIAPGGADQGPAQ